MLDSRSRFRYNRRGYLTVSASVLFLYPEKTMKRSIKKAITWRCIAFLTTMMVAYWVQESAKSIAVTAALIAGLDSALKIVLYVAHEEVWNATDNDNGRHRI